MIRRWFSRSEPAAAPPVHTHRVAPFHPSTAVRQELAGLAELHPPAIGDLLERDELLQNFHDAEVSEVRLLRRLDPLVVDGASIVCTGRPLDADAIARLDRHLGRLVVLQDEDFADENGHEVDVAAVLAELVLGAHVGVLLGIESAVFDRCVDRYGQPLAALTRIGRARSIEVTDGPLDIAWNDDGERYGTDDSSPVRRYAWPNDPS